MSKLAARMGDMHVCPMVTPGTPPVPHVGGPIIGPGVANVFIGGMPAAVLGDMCVCTGPPDSIISGSTGVFIGGKPAARMGDSTAHGGTIAVGCATVFIGESGSGGGGSSSLVNVKLLLKEMDQVEGVEKSTLSKLKVAAVQKASVYAAAEAGLPFCEVCEPTPSTDNEENDQNDANSNVSPPADADSEISKKIKRVYFTDVDGNEINEVQDESTIRLIVESENIAGEEIIVTLYDHAGDFTYQGKEILHNQLVLNVSGDQHTIELGVIVNSK